MQIIRELRLEAETRVADADADAGAGADLSGLSHRHRVGSDEAY